MANGLRRYRRPLSGMDRRRGHGADAPVRARARGNAALRTPADRLGSVDAAERRSATTCRCIASRSATTAGTEYYVSEKTGEPVMRTTASGRFWGYLGAVLHWLYFTPLRRHAAFWNSFVVWSSLIGTRHVRAGDRHRRLALLACRAASACAARRHTPLTRHG